MSDELRPTEFLWNGAVGLARHDHVEMSFKAWPAALLPGRAIGFLIFIPVTRQFELIEGGIRREMSGPEKAAVFAFLKGFAAAGHGFFNLPAPPPCSSEGHP
jgi:hypothetical protein